MSNARTESGNVEDESVLKSDIVRGEIEEAEELFESQEAVGGSEKVVHCIQIDISERHSFQDEGEYSGQSSATATPLERSQEVSQVESTGIILKEWNSLINVLARIPIQAQKGLSTFDLKLTCISTIGDEILVIGTNVGIVYWYNRKTDAFDRLRCEGVHPVTCLSCVGTVDYMVAAGNQVGLVTIFQIPRYSTEENTANTKGQPEVQHDTKNKKSQKFHIQDLHKGAITALEWSRNGMKLFSGDQTGHVILTDIDYDLVQIRSSILLSENYEIVQLSYARKNLLICSTFRSIIYSLENRSFDKVGSLERKVTGKFGGLIVSSAWEESPKIYSVRPGARLWVANLSGVVQHTIKYKDLILSGSQPEIHVIKAPKTPRPLPQDVQFTKLHRFMKDYLVTFHKDILHIIDARNTVVLSVCKELKSILDVAVNKDEIFILESTRNVIRLSAKPDNFSTLASSNFFTNPSVINGNGNSTFFTTPGGISSSSSAFLTQQQQQSDTFSTSTPSAGAGGKKILPDIMSASISDFRFSQEPINYLTSKLKETSERVIPKINPLINSIKTVIEADVDIEDGQKLLESGLPPPVISLEPGDISGFDMFTSYPPPPPEPAFVPEPERFQKITNLPYEDVVVDAKPVRKTKKSSKSSKHKGGLNKKDGLSSDAASDSVSVSSAYSNTSGSDTNNINIPKSSTSSSVRKLSFKSDYTLSSSNSGSEGVMSASEHQLPKDQFGFPKSLSQSWSVGSLVPNKPVTTEELHLKEELLARRLKWPELLPESARNSEDMFDEGPSRNTPSSSSPPDADEFALADSNYWEIHLSKEPRDTKREDRVSICTLVAPSADENTDTDSKTVSLENGSSFGTVIDTKNDEEHGNKDSQECSEDEYYQDIYTRYRNKDSISSYNSALSFGPPSGSSYVSGGPAALGAAALAHTESLHENSYSEEVEEMARTPTDAVELENSKESNEIIATSETSSRAVEELDSIVESKVVTDEHWRKWRLPGPITQICLCDHYILCVGSKGQVYFASLDTVTLHWKTTGYNASSMAISPCGSIVWRIYKGDLLSLTNLSSPSAPISDGIDQWTKLTYKKVVLCATVQKSFGWIIKVDGSLEFCTGLLKTTMVPYFETVYTPWPMQEVTCFGHRLWGLTSDGRIVFRTGTSHHNPKGVDWLELRWSVSDIPPACSISCGDVRKEDGIASVWFSDANGDLYFTFEERDSRGAWIPWKVSASGFISPSASPEASNSVIFKSIKEVGKSLKSLVQPAGTKTGLYLASSKSSVWFTGVDENIIYGNRNSIVGHNWRPLRVDKGLTVPASWTSIYANSIYKGHGYLWISDSKGNLFYLPHSGGKIQKLDLPIFAEGQILVAAPAPEALWTLSCTGDIYGRDGITTTDCIGKDWSQISLSTLKSSQFVHISCGSDVAWAVDDRGEIYMRVGSLKPPGKQDMSPAWNKVESSSCCKGIFTKVYVGANGSMVWALDKDKRVYVRQAVFPDYPIGTGWLLVKGVEAIMLSLSDSAVWALTSEGHIYRRHGITQTNFVGDYWRKVPGLASAITVSLCDELWALSPEGYLLKHSKKIMELVSSPMRAGSSRVVFEDEEEDEDWEIVDNPEV